MGTATAPATLQQLIDMEDPANGYYELHDGAITFMTFPLQDHTDVQDTLVDLLKPRLKSFGRISKELPYAATASEARRADVAAVSHSRWKAIPRKALLPGSPELVIEVVSAANKPGDLKQLELLCLATGSIQFWTVYGDLRLVEVKDNSGHSATYGPGSGSSIPLDAFGCSEPLPVDSIFDE
jgi:Uma2 family endonuclease